METTRQDLKKPGHNKGGGQHEILVKNGSPSISNKVPNSLAFKIKNHNSNNYYADEDIVIQLNKSKSPDSKRIKLFLGQEESLQNTKQNLNFDDENPLSTRRVGGIGDLYSLRDKDELTRNIP